MTAKDLIFGYKIECFGDVGASPPVDRVLRFASSLLPDDPDGVYRATLIRESFQAVESSADFRAGPSQTGGISQAIGLDAETLYLFGRTKETLYSTILSNVNDYATTSITFDRTDLEGQVVYVGREAILVGTHASGGTYNGCTRGYYTTTPTAHLDDRSVFRAPHPSTYYGRVVTYFQVPRTGSYADEETIQQFVMRTATLDPELATTAIRLDCLGILDAMRESRSVPGQWRARTAAGIGIDVEGLRGAYGVGWTMRAEDVPGVLSDPVPSGDDSNFTMEIDGENVFVVSAGTGGLYAYDYAQPLYGAMAEIPDLDASARQVWTTSPLFPLGSALGYEGSLYRGDAITVALNLMISQPGVDSDYNLDVDFGVRLPALAIDVAYCEQLRAVLGAEIKVPNFVWGLEADEDSLTLDLIEQKLLAPFQLAFGPGPSGGLAIVRLFDVAPVFETPPTIDTRNLRRDERVGSDMGWDSTVSTVTATYDARPGVGSRTATAFDSRLRTRRLGKGGEIDIDLGAVVSLEVVQSVLADFAGRWRNPTPTLTFSLGPDDVIHVGGGADLTFQGVLGRAFDHGGYPREGVIDSRVVITERRIGLDATHYSALHVGLRYNRTGRRTSSAGIIGYDDPTRTFTLGLQAYVRANHPSYANDLESFEVGDVIQWRSGVDGTLVAGTMTVSAITAPDKLEVVVSPGAIVPGVGDVILNEEYDSSVAAQQTRHAYIGDVDGTVGAAGDDGYQYQG